MNDIHIENEVIQTKINPSRELLESINQTISYLLNSTRKKIEDPMRNIPFYMRRRKGNQS